MMFGRCLQIMNDQIIKIYTRQQYLTCRHICKRPYGGPNNNDKASHRKTVHPDTVDGYSRFIKSALAVMSVETVAMSSWQRVKLAGSEAGPGAPRQHAAKLCTMLLIGQSTSRPLHEALIKFRAGAEI